MTKILMLTVAVLLVASLTWAQTYTAKEGQYITKESVQVEEAKAVETKSVHSLQAIDKNIAWIDAQIVELQAAKTKLQTLRGKVATEAGKVILYVPPVEEPKVEK